MPDLPDVDLIRDSLWSYLLSPLQELQSEVVRIWNAHSGKACVGVNWELFATQDDTKVCTCMLV